MTIPEAFQIALQHHQAGRLGEAEALYRQILLASPNHPQALHYLGVIAHQAGRHKAAIELIRQSIVRDPDNPEAHSNLGAACRATNRLDEAVAALRRALALRPGYPEAHINLATALSDQGRHDEAIMEYHRALELKPGYAEAYSNLGNALREQGQMNDAITAYRRAIGLKADLAEAHFNLGNVLADLWLLDEAIISYSRALEIKPGLAQPHNNLGNALRLQGRLEEAQAAFHRALSLGPGNPETHNNLGLLLRDQGKLEAAVAVFHRALAFKPHYPDAHNNLAATLSDQGRLDEAISEYRCALALKPDFPRAWNNMGNAFKDGAQFDEALGAYRRALQIEPNHVSAHSNLIYMLHFLPQHDAGTIATERRRWNRQFSDPLRGYFPSHANNRTLYRTLKIGYVSPDFRQHVIGRNLIPLFQHHDHQSFEIHCYSGVTQPDSLTDEFRRRADHWRDTSGIGDDALSEMIRRDGVDILVDLTQHLKGNRLLMFARKPAPVQVSFAGYPETTGLDAIEYRISDRYLNGNPVDAAFPNAVGEPFEAGSARPADEITGVHEQVLLIDSFWCYDPCGASLEVNELPAVQQGNITFGSLCNFCKINAPLLRLWAKVLGRVRDSRLMILSPEGSHRQQTLDLLESEGIDRRRVEFVKLRPRLDYLELYHRLDIVLDTFPYNGHTTSLDALWMGVPVVSLAGHTPVGRAGLSLLTTLGLSGLVARSNEEYISIATSLAGDLTRLAELRATLRPRMQTSPLTDAQGFARQIESAYREMWQAWIGNQAPIQGQ